jgi:hypothetical protein
MRVPSSDECAHASLKPHFQNNWPFNTTFKPKIRKLPSFRPSVPDFPPWRTYTGSVHRAAHALSLVYTYYMKSYMFYVCFVLALQADEDFNDEDHRDGDYNYEHHRYEHHRYEHHRYEHGNDDEEGELNT